MAQGYGRGGYSSGPYSIDALPPVSIWTPVPDAAANVWFPIQGAEETATVALKPLPVVVVEPS